MLIIFKIINLSIAQLIFEVFASYHLSAFQGGEQYISSRSSPTSTPASSARDSTLDGKEKHKKRHRRHGSRTSSFSSEQTQSETASVASLGPMEMLPRWRERVTSPPSVPRLALEAQSARAGADANVATAAGAGVGVDDESSESETITDSVSQRKVLPVKASARSTDAGRGLEAPADKPQADAQSEEDGTRPVPPQSIRTSDSRVDYLYFDLEIEH